MTEANPSADLTREEYFALSAKAVGLDYPGLLQRILTLGVRHPSPWKVAEAG